MDKLVVGNRAPDVILLNDGISFYDAALGALQLSELERRYDRLMSLALSIARRSMREAESTEDGLAQVEARFTRLARANRMLVEPRQKRGSMRAVCSQALQPFGEIGRAWHLSGPTVDLGEELLLALSLAFHDLATESAATGALAMPSGRIDLDWRLRRLDSTRASLAVRWLERNGPPARNERGNTLEGALTRALLSRQLVEPVVLRFTADGLDCRFGVGVPAI